MHASDQEINLLRKQSLQLSVARVALEHAKAYIISMHGDPRSDKFGDEYNTVPFKILASVLDQIEEGLKI